MADPYRYPVYFECDSLPEKQIGRIEKYFRIHRKSNGGDCGPLRSAGHKTYSVAFKLQEDQQAVLKKSKHVVNDLVFTVRDSLEPRTSSPVTTSTTSRDGAAPVQSPQSSPTSTLPLSGEECELQFDSYLLRYLKECPKAEKDLERELASLACSAKIYPEEGKVLVKSLDQAGAADEVRSWKAKVEKVFEGYLCHYELDPQNVKALFQSCSSHQITDEVKVYSEVGMAVVVGECSQVKARVKDVMDLLEKQGSSSGEKQTSLRRLGEAKLRLLWKEIKQSLGRDYPGVEVTQRDAGQLVLEGPVEEILKAGNWISEKENSVLKRKVSDMSPHVLAFLRKAYGGPAGLSDFLGVVDEVEVELRDTDLRFFSLSADKLDDTEKKLKEEFKEIKTEVPNFSFVASELREKLESKTNEMNQGQCRAEVMFGSDSMVSLLGHAEEVEELSKTVTQFILDQSSVESAVHVSGAQKLASSSLSELNTATVASYILCDELQVLVCQGDITKQEADVLVNAANEDLDHCGGLAAALSKAGGPEIQSESNGLVKCSGKIPVGDVVVTTGGNLNCKKLLHAVGPVCGKSGGKERMLLEKTIHSALDLSELMRFQSIAIPCISSGAFGVPVNVCSEAIVIAVKEFSSRRGRSLRRIILIDNREEVVGAMRVACDRLLQGIGIENHEPLRGAPGNGVHLEIIQGTIETQQVDAVVSPMVGLDPLSTRIGNSLSTVVGSQLTARFRKEAGHETQIGDTVLVEGLPGLPSNAVFFLGLIPWDDDQDGTAVQVLRLGINNILTSCESRGFTSVAFPVLGAGIALHFPDSVVARILLEEVHVFRQTRDSRTPLLVRIVIHPNDEESSAVFESVQKSFQLTGFKNHVHQTDQVSTPKRIVLLGKTGSGKSNLANTIFGEDVFKICHTPSSGTGNCQTETKSVNGRSITLIDTPGFFDTDKPQEDLKPEIVRCITECAPGPHAFLILLKVERFTEQEDAVIHKICQCFSEDALKYAVIVFTHGDNLPKGEKIEDFVSKNKNLSDLVKKCGNRCHVIDNKYWKNKQQNNYRSNQFQVEELLKTIDKMVLESNGDYYSNKMLQRVEKEIQKEEERIKQSSQNMPVEEIRKEAKTRVSKRFLMQLTGTTVGALLGAFFGLAAMVGVIVTAINNCAALMKLVKNPAAAVGGAATAATAGEVGVVIAGVSSVVAAATGGVVGGMIGCDAAEEAESLSEAAEMAYHAVIKTGKDALKRL